MKQQPEAVIRLLSRVVIKETAAICVHLSSVHGAVDYNNKGRFFKLVTVLAEGSRRVCCWFPVNGCWVLMRHKENGRGLSRVISLASLCPHLLQMKRTSSDGNLLNNKN